MRPARQYFRTLEPERFLSAPGFHRKQGEHFGYFRGGYALREFQRSQVVAMQALSEVVQHRVPLVRHDPVDDQLLPGHSQRQ